MRGLASSCLLFVLLLTGGLAPRAAAAFAQTVQNVQLEFGQREATVVFVADSAIKRARALCDCTSLSFSANQLTAHVDVSGFTQDVRKELQATTADGITTRLAMDIRVPQAVRLSSRSLIWKLGEAPAMKELILRIPPSSPVSAVTKADLSGEDFTYSTVTEKPGAVYRVNICPRHTQKRALNRLIIRTNSSDPRYASYIVYLSIQP